MSDARSDLNVRLYDGLVGELGTEGGRRATYDWNLELVAGDLAARRVRPDLVSASLTPPLVLGRAVVPTASVSAADNFFGGLLPEGIWLQNLANDSP